MNPSDSYIINITNLKKSYDRDEETRFRVYARNKNWNPNIYSVASSDIETTPIDDLYYKITREADDLTVIDYGTGSIKYTATSYDVSGNYVHNANVTGLAHGPTLAWVQTKPVAWLDKEMPLKYENIQITGGERTQRGLSIRGQPCVQRQMYEAGQPS